METIKKGDIIEKLRRHENYYIWREKVFERDGYICRKCGKESDDYNHLDIQAHHIIPIKLNKNLVYNIDNGITLCKKCHIKTYGERGTDENNI